jgi:hypothetical protein
MKMRTLRFYLEDEDNGRAYYERPHEDGVPLFAEPPRRVNLGTFGIKRGPELLRSSLHLLFAANSR